MGLKKTRQYNILKNINSKTRSVQNDEIWDVSFSGRSFKRNSFKTRRSSRGVDHGYLFPLILNPGGKENGWKKIKIWKPAD